MGRQQYRKITAVGMVYIAILAIVPMVWSLPKRSPIGTDTTEVIIPEDLPPTPPSLSVWRRSATDITLQWTDHALDEQGYELQQRLSESNSAWQTIATWGPQTGQLEYTHTGLQPDSAYCYPPARLS